MSYSVAKHQWPSTPSEMPTKSVIGMSFTWTEATDDTGTSSIKASRLANSQSIMTYMTDAANIYRGSAPLTTRQRAFWTSLLGGFYDNGSGLKKIPPLQHPYLSGLYATDVVDVSQRKYQKGITSVDNSNGGSFAAYDVAQLSVLFQSLPFKFNLEPTIVSGSPVAFNPNWISVESHATNTYTNAPWGFYKYTEGIYGALSLYAVQGVNIRRAEEQINLTVHMVPQQFIFEGADSNNSLLIRTPTVITVGSTLTGSPCGYINAQQFMQCPPQTLLLNSIDLIPYGDLLGDNRYYNVRMQFLFNGWGWNKVLDPSGNPNRIVSYSTGLSPYSTIDFNALMDIFNPASQWVA